MPLFFVVSGYFAESAFRKGTWGKVLARAVGFLWPCVAFGAMFALVQTAMGTGGGIRWFFHFSVHDMPYSRWFLRSLAAIWLFSAVIVRECRTERPRWAAFVALYAAFLFLPAQLRFLLPWIGGEPTIHMLPYFVFGLMILRKRDCFRCARVAIPCGIVFLAIVFLEGNSNNNGMNYWTVSLRWREVFLDRNGLLCFFARTLVGVTGSVFLLWGLDRLLANVPALSRLAALGTTTLGVYVCQEWPLTQFHGNTKWLPLPHWTHWPVAIGWLLLCHLVICGIRRTPGLSTVFFGNEKWLARVFDKFLPGKRDPCAGSA